jgi:malonyl-CoA decarboxylase
MTVERWRTPEPPRAQCKALEPPAVRLLHEFVGVPQGVKFVVDLRAELRSWAAPTLRHGC